MITIAGGTGAVGSSLVQTLLGDGAQLRVLTRDPQKARAALGDGGPEVAGINFDDPVTLEAGFKGSDAAFLSTGTSDRQVRDEIAMIDAAIRAGVPYLVNLSVGGAGGDNADDVLQWHTQIDAYLAAQDVASALIRPATYTDTIVGVASSFVPAGAWGGAAGSGRVCLTDTRDVAAVAAVLLAEGAGRHAGHVYDMSGPAPVTMADVAGYISEVLGTTVEYHDRTREQQRGVLESAGVPALLVEVLLGLDDLTRSGIFAEPSPTVADLTGRAPRSVQAWVREHAAAFTPASA